MGTITDKLCYLNDTKQAIKNAINEDFEVIDNNNVFREYAEEISLNNRNYKDLIPKVILNTTNIADISNAAKLNKALFTHYGKTYQADDPTPEIPQDIVNINGKSKISIIGDNFFNLNWFTFRTTNGITATLEDDHILLNGTAVGAAYINFSVPAGKINVSSSPTWYIKADTTVGTLHINRSSGGAVNLAVTGNLLKQTFTSNTVTSGYLVIPSGTTLENCKVYINVKKDNVDLLSFEFKPYQENEYEIDLKSENQFDTTLLSQEQNYNTYDDNTKLWTSNSGVGYGKSLLYNAVGGTSSRDTSKLIRLEPSKNYKIEFFDFVNNTGSTENILNYVLYNENGDYVSRTIGKSVMNISTTETAYYLDIQRNNNNGTFLFSSLYISEYDINLCQIDTYKDKIYPSNGKWYFTNYFNKIDSYNAETITTSYISTTGNLDTGATVYYYNGGNNENEITSSNYPTLYEQLDAIKLFEGVNHIAVTNESGLDVEFDVEYYKDWKLG